MTLLLCAVGVNATITAKWDWKNGTPASIASVNIQNAVGSVASNVDGIAMYVDASTGGKLTTNGDNVQYNTGTKLQVPVVSTLDVVTVKGHSYNWTSIKIGGNVYTDQTKAYTATADDVDQGYVEIEAVNDCYLYSVEVELAYMPSSPITATWDFAGNCASLPSKASGGAYTAATMVSDDANISMSIVYNSGQIKNNDNSYQITETVELKIPVGSTDDVVTVNGFSGYFYYTIGGGSEINKDNSPATVNYTATSSDVAQGYVSIVSTNNNNYLCSIKLTKKSFVTATISSIGWSTFCTNNILDFTNVAGLKSYIITGANTSNVISMSQVTESVAGGTGLLLNGTAGASYNIPIANTSIFDVTANKLVGYALENTGTHTVSAAESGYTHYVLVASSGNAVFKYIGGTSATINPGQAYLRFANSDIVSGAREFTLDGGVTGISEMEDVRSKKDDIYYDLNGRRVLYPTKGLYIVNGKKVVMK